MQIIVNSGSGDSDKEHIQEAVRAVFESAGVEAKFLLAQNGGELADLARRAANKPGSWIVAAGGDGTISTVADVIAGTDKVLGVIPIGTFNYFAKSLGIPLEPDLAARNLIEGEPAPVDIATVNDRLFLINTSLGLYPQILRQREQIYRRVVRSELVAYLSALVSLIQFRSSLHVRLNAEGKTISQRTPLLYVGCNQYQMESFDIPGQSCLRSGRLAFCVVRPTGRWGLLRLALRALLHRARGAEELQVLCAGEAWIETRRRRVSLALDGEVLSMRTPLHYRVVPGALRVVVPRDSRYVSTGRDDAERQREFAEPNAAS